MGKPEQPPARRPRDCAAAGGHDWRAEPDGTETCDRCDARCARDAAGRIVAFAAAGVDARDVPELGGSRRWRDARPVDWAAAEHAAAAG